MTKKNNFIRSIRQKFWKKRRIVAGTWYFPQNEDPTSVVLLDSQRNSAFSITPASLNARISIYHCLFDTWIQMYHRESGPRGSQTVLRPLSIVQARLGQGGRL